MTGTSTPQRSSSRRDVAVLQKESPPLLGRGRTSTHSVTGCPAGHSGKQALACPAINGRSNVCITPLDHHPCPTLRYCFTCRGSIVNSRQVRRLRQEVAARRTQISTSGSVPRRPCHGCYGRYQRAQHLLLRRRHRRI